MLCTSYHLVQMLICTKAISHCNLYFDFVLCTKRASFFSYHFVPIKSTHYNFYSGFVWTVFCTKIASTYLYKIWPKSMWVNFFIRNCITSFAFYIYDHKCCIQKTTTLSIQFLRFHDYYFACSHWYARSVIWLD